MMSIVSGFRYKVSEKQIAAEEDHGMPHHSYLIKVGIF
jgi:hypothetical protein